MSCQGRTAGWGFRCDLIERNQLWYSLWRYASGVELEPYLIWQMKWVYHHITGTVRSPAWISRGLDRVSGTIWLWFNGQGCQIPSDRSWPGSFALRTRDHNSTICSTLVSLCPFSPCTQTGILRKEDPLVTRLPWSQKDNSDRTPNDNASGMIEHWWIQRRIPFAQDSPFLLTEIHQLMGRLTPPDPIVIGSSWSWLLQSHLKSLMESTSHSWLVLTVNGKEPLLKCNCGTSLRLVHSLCDGTWPPVLFLPSLPPYIYCGKQINGQGLPFHTEKP